MSYLFDDAVHVLGLDLLTDDDLTPQPDWGFDPIESANSPKEYACLRFGKGLYNSTR